jgi:DNA polymerase-1
MKGLYKNILNEVSEEHKTNHLRERNSRVLIIDGLNTFIRSWSVNPTMNEDGDHTGGVVGSLKSIGYQIKKFNPTRVILTFDGKGGNNNRKKIYEGYKKDRGKNRFRVNRQYDDLMTEEQERLSMKQQFVWLNDILNYLPIKTMIYEGVEADDVIGYLTTQITKKDKDNEEVIIVSTDKDFLQLVDDRVKVFSPTKKKLYDRQSVFDEFGIWPQNILLYRTMDGDKSDNIPGIKGCGLKTLIKRFPEFKKIKISSIDEFYTNCEDNKGKIKIYDTIF